MVDHGTIQCVIWPKNKNGSLRIEKCNILKKKESFFLWKSNHLLVLKESIKVPKALLVLYLLFECLHDTNPSRIKNKKKFCVFFFKLSLKKINWMSFRKKNCIEQSKMISKNGRLPIFFFFQFSFLFIKIYLQYSKILCFLFKRSILNHFFNQKTSIQCIICNFTERSKKNSIFLHVFIYLGRESVTIEN